MKRVVIIDDHPMIRGTVSGVLRADPELEVIGECGDGEDGLAMVLSENPDLVILDLDLPRLDGLAMIRRIRAHNTKMCILVLSAKPERVMASYTRVAGANGYVGKGREISELITAIKTVLYGYDCFPADTANSATENGLDLLSAREVEVLQHIVRGVSNRDIAARLFLSDKTVSTYKSRIQEKLGLSSLAALIEFASLHRLAD
ncbi:Virulence factors putative positive transcription regulator BvgA [Paraburkholderia domus]|uniref:Virulence factors putative positive transcription regulator BvgA n=1 Tax=Paraburkholderia domus TaxID=2793075 RepID=A0A9N8QWI0_9BURK|nr:response regulator transcription factor [Paraburkholderia domus]MBK5050937.1 response regulator transcription factor [Burkholderia sp. R-70006]MBK5061076.1 response regulator transcription factor [Burkholderia sp. R-70199]MBK5088194.1 response regulator transcription factor [Burkholderia sp. R-69927]MBK5121196.1 response regulator transcription factor [Burkholderia sp. R-69980]MBK5166271.1 response regulator transcription factor [Burkholderia sp. R-70211]